MARWRDDVTAANPATEVLRSTRPALVTQPFAHEYLSSSPWSVLDAHHEAFARGDTPEQLIFHAASLVAKPTLTEAECRALEPDGPTFDREYGAQPMAASESCLFDPRAVEAAAEDYDLPRRAGPGEYVTAGADFGFRRDCSALVVVHRAGDVRRVGDLLELRPSAGAPLRPSSTVAECARVCRLHGLRSLMADAHYRESVVEHLRAADLGLLDAPLDVAATYTHARVLMHGGLVRLPRHRQLIRDLCEVRSAPTATGRTRIILPRGETGGHADLVSALVLALWQRVGVEVVEHVETAAMRGARESAVFTLKHRSALRCGVFISPPVTLEISILGFRRHVHGFGDDRQDQQSA